MFPYGGLPERTGTNKLNVHKIMADEIKETPEEETPEGEEEPETSKESSPEPTGEEEAKKEEPQIPLSRLRQKDDKIKELEKELLKTKKEEEIPEGEKSVRDVLGKIETERKEKEQQEEKQLREDFDELHNIYGKFNEDKLAKVADHYGCYDGDAVNWDRAMELYNTPGILQKVTGGKEPPATKIPSSQRTSDVPRKEPYDVKGKSMWEILEESKKELPE